MNLDMIKVIKKNLVKQIFSKILLINTFVFNIYCMENCNKENINPNKKDINQLNIQKKEQKNIDKNTNKTKSKLSSMIEKWGENVKNENIVEIKLKSYKEANFICNDDFFNENLYDKSTLYNTNEVADIIDKYIKYRYYAFIIETNSYENIIHPYITNIENITMSYSYNPYEEHIINKKINKLIVNNTFLGDVYSSIFEAIKSIGKKVTFNIYMPKKNQINELI